MDPPSSIQTFVSRQRPLHHVQDNEDTSFTHHTVKVESYPRGYPLLSSFMDSDRDFVMFRCFGRMQTRILLHKQDELTELEERLDQLDKNESTPYFLSTRRQDRNTERRNILSEAEQKLKEYNALLAAHFQNVERPKPKEANITSVCNWMKGHKPLVKLESTMFNDWNDLRCPARPADHGGLEMLLETWAAACNSWGIFKFLHSSNEVSRSDDPYVLLFEPSRILAVSRLLTTIFAVLSLIIPVTALYAIKAMSWRLGIITVFTTLFSSTLCWLTQSRNYEIFSATAAYCAVMVVFVGNLT